jgi:hypothetical protein
MQAGECSYDPRMVARVRRRGRVGQERAYGYELDM